MDIDYRCPVCNEIYCFVASGRQEDDESIHCEIYYCTECGSEFTRYFSVETENFIP